VRLARHAGVAALAALAILSLLPRDQMTRTEIDGWIEHALAYGGTMGLLAIGHAGRIAPACAALIAYAGLLEIAQFLAPGRSPGTRDFLAGAAGALSVAIAAAAIRRRGG